MLRLAFAVLALTTLPAFADPLPQPGGDVILTVSGDIDVTNAGNTAVFDLGMLRALGVTEIVTETIWTEGEQRFEGVALVDLMARLGVEDGTLRATAINDYAVDVPVSDAVEGGPIIAYIRNGAPMSVRDKGPLWIVYPYDRSAEYRSEVIYSRSIWQLNRIAIQD
ncbi:MAG: oxidoreductase [Rhodobacteraceae bacterium]|nr:oxidoreductase [Paracoccaceae bacterium]